MNVRILTTIIAVLFLLPFFSSAAADDKSLSDSGDFSEDEPVQSGLVLKPGTVKNGNNFIEVFDGPKSLKKIVCESTEQADQRCYTVKLSVGGFLLIDCYPHDSILQSCKIRKFTNKGDEDENFKTPFNTASAEALGPQRSIDAVESARELPNSKGRVQVTGSFQYSDIDGISDRERKFCIGDEDCASFDGYSSEAQLIFDPTGKVAVSKILKKAVFPYSKEQVLAELDKRILKLEESSKAHKKNHGEEKAELSSYRKWKKEISKAVQIPSHEAQSAQKTNETTH